MTKSRSLPELAALYDEIGVELLAQATTEDAMHALVQTALDLVPGAEHAGITRGRPGKFETVAASSDLATLTDVIQYELSSGPCVDAVLQQTVFRTGDLRVDERWPEFGQRAFAELGVLSMLSFRLFLEDDDLIAGLNMYSTSPEAFDEQAEAIGTLLATHGSLGIAALTSRERVNNLERALATSRDIGVAMGVLMSHHKITREQAFDLLRIASQHQHRKLAEVAVEVGDTGALSLPDLSRAD